MLSVTQVIPSDFSMVDPDVLDIACERGKIFHRAMMNYANGVWVAKLPNNVQLYFDSGRRWFDKYVDKVIFVEKEFVHSKYKYVMHPDLVAIIVGNILPSVIDYKTPAAYFEKQWSAQLAAYYFGIEESEKIELDGAISMRVKKDGRDAKANHVKNLNESFNCFLMAFGSFKCFNG